MIYLLLGENSYRALKKIADIKSAFYKKGGGALAVVEINGPDVALEKVSESIIAGNLFAARRLVVLKHTIEAHPSLINLIKENTKELAAANDVFIFWENKFSDKGEALQLFKKIAEKIEETNTRTPEELNRWLEKEAGARGIQIGSLQRRTMIEEQGVSVAEPSEWSLLQELEKTDLGTNEHNATSHQQVGAAQNAIFSFVDRVFGNKFSRALIAFRQSKQEGIDEADLSRMLLWKLKNIFIVQKGEAKKLNSYVAQKASADGGSLNEKSVLDAFWEGILADSALKRDSKNTDEHVESYMLSMKRKTTKVA